MNEGIRYFHAVSSHFAKVVRFKRAKANDRGGSDHRFSPCMVATTFLECRAARNSRYQMPCQVPVFIEPSVIGIVTLAPTNADLICA